jgi:CubicO group peptidase (beta-lactamase class C family)
MKKLNLIFIFFALPLIITNAQEFNKKKLDAYLNVLEENNKIMGSIAISHNGSVIYSKAFGYDDIETKEKSTTETKYRVGSISKTFTSCLILMAVEENKLKLENTIESYFPNVPNAEKITIKNLLNHSSGIFNFTNSKDIGEWSSTQRTKKELIERIEKPESVFEPGSKNEYSNSNFILLTFILEEIYNKSYSEILKEKITKPNKLESTYLGSKIDIQNNECHSYYFSGEWEKTNETNMSVPLGAGGVVSNPEDLNRFIEYLFAGKIISKTSLEKMTDTQNNYGLGIFKTNKQDLDGFAHNGGIDGFVSTMVYFPNEQLSITLTFNGINYNRNEIFDNALKTFLDIEYDIPTFTKKEIPVDELKKYVGDYSSETVPFPISIVLKNDVLLMEAEGQKSFVLEPVEANKFSIELIQANLEFKIDENQMIFKRPDELHTFKRK